MEFMLKKSTSMRVGVFVDTANMYLNGGQRMRYDVLREFATRDGAELFRLNAYVTFDSERARNDSLYDKGVKRFYAVLRDFGYKVIVKEVRWFEDESGKRYGKANADLDMAVDLLQQSENLDRIVLATGDGDFARVVEAVQAKGCRVEVLVLDNGSRLLRQEADLFISGFLIPSLVPAENGGAEAAWGEFGSTVRGVCYFHKNDYGFVRFLGDINPNLWVTDTKRPDSPYLTAYFNDSQLPRDFDKNQLPSYNHIFEFKIVESAHGEGNLEARGITLKSWLPG